MITSESLGLTKVLWSATSEACGCTRGINAEIVDGVALLSFCGCERGWRAKYGMPEACRDWTLETWPGPDGARQVALDWEARVLAGDGAWLIIMGPIGIGKTGLAAAMYRRYVDRQPPASLLMDGRPRWWLVPDLLQATKDAMGTEADGMVLSAAANARLLVLDDVGVERPTDYNLDVVRLLLMHRHASMLPTIITTSLSAAQLREHVGPWNADRMRDRGYFVLLDGASRRGRGYRIFRQKGGK